MDNPNIDGYETYCIGKMDAYCKELEAKNGELEKRNEMLAHQLKYAETILTEVQADKFKLREKLEIAVEALEFMATFKHPDYVSRSRGTIFQVANEALSKIKSEGL